MRRLRALLFGLTVAVLLLVVLGSCSARQQSLTLDEKAQDIYRSVMCPICAGQTIEQSHSALATQMRVTVREKLEQGWAKEEILQFFVERYGDSVLAVPTKSGFNLIAWLAPITGIIVGGIVTWLAIRQWTRRVDESSPEGAAIAQNSGDDKYRRQLEQELKSFDNKTGFR